MSGSCSDSHRERRSNPRPQQEQEKPRSAFTRTWQSRAIDECYQPVDWDAYREKYGNIQRLDPIPLAALAATTLARPVLPERWRVTVAFVDIAGAFGPVMQVLCETVPRLVLQNLIAGIEILVINLRQCL